jgi:predicted RNA-binding Zn-ribbon protein involved in translation (DUF1610 family)
MPISLYRDMGMLSLVHIIVSEICENLFLVELRMDWKGLIYMSMQSDDKPGCFGYIIGLVRDIFGRSNKAPISLPYKLRDDFLSPTELSYYKVLSSILGVRGTLFTKVSLSDIIFVTKTDKYMSFFNRISQRHVDFLLCEASTLKPVLAIELDDSSHNRPSRKERDRFLDEVLRAADLPLLRVSPKMQYTREEVVSQLKPFLPSPRTPAAAPPSQDNLSQSQTTISEAGAAPPMCPKCGVPMVLRVASQGRQKGNQFYGCPNFPKCRQILSINYLRGAR